MAAPNDFNMDEAASTSANHRIGGPRPISGSVPPLAVSEWDLLLKKLGLTDIEALTAVREGTEASQLITRFVRGQFRQHFVPEDVLLAVKMQYRELLDKYSLIFGCFRAVNRPIHTLDLTLVYERLIHHQARSIRKPA